MNLEPGSGADLETLLDQNLMGAQSSDSAESSEKSIRATEPLIHDDSCTASVFKLGCVDVIE